jgi:hypothetical protein
MAAMAVNAVGGERKRCKDEAKEARRRMRITSLASSWSKRKLAAMAAHDDDHLPPSSAIDGGECYVEAMIMDDLLLYILGCGLLSIRDLYPVSLVCRYMSAIVPCVSCRVVSCDNKCEVVLCSSLTLVVQTMAGGGA